MLCKATRMKPYFFPVLSFHAGLVKQQEKLACKFISGIYLRLVFCKVWTCLKNCCFFYSYLLFPQPISLDRSDTLFLASTILEREDNVSLLEKYFLAQK